jgi:hypothetical protein
LGNRGGAAAAENVSAAAAAGDRPYESVIDRWLVADPEEPRKQRHTARRIWQRLVTEHGASVAEVTVSRYVARRRAELGLDNHKVTVPQAHEPGAEAGADFGEFHAVVAGVLLKLWLFVMRLKLCTTIAGFTGRIRL